MGEVRFIRKNGRIIPIRAGKKKSKKVESPIVSGAKLGAKLGAGVSLAGGAIRTSALFAITNKKFTGADKAETRLLRALGGAHIASRTVGKTLKRGVKYGAAGAGLGFAYKKIKKYRKK